MNEPSYFRPNAEPRTHRDTPARTAMIKSVYGQSCPSADRIERALIAIFDAMQPEQQGAVLRRLGWEPTREAGGAPSSARKATNEEIRAWVDRHDLGISSVTDARCAFEDAESHHLTRGAAPTDGGQKK